MRCLGLITVCLLASPAAAQSTGSASTTLTLRGTAQPVCTMPAPQAEASGPVTFSNGVIDFGQLIDSGSALVKGSAITLTFPGVMCNYNAMLSVTTEKGGLVNTDSAAAAAAASAGFLSRVDYAMRVRWGTLEFSSIANLTPGGGLKQATGGANLGDLILTIETQEGTTPVLQGQYEDTVTVRVGAAF